MDYKIEKSKGSRKCKGYGEEHKISKGDICLVHSYMDYMYMKSDSFCIDCALRILSKELKSIEDLMKKLNDEIV